MEHYVCVHGHFYQPPRENPWLEEVELQDSAYPYHDWNDRIAEECYRRNAASRILGPDKKIIDIVNNYSKISFDFGPTLFSWLERHAPDIYKSVIDADKKSRELFSGHGAAIAQAYNHIIMPLANSRDKRTQVQWGLYDFEHRFNRKSEGMWLPETAVDMETLDMLAEFGVKFTILAPHQAKRFRGVGNDNWQNIESGRIDTTRPYLCRLASGRTISLFFYHGPTSQGVASGTILQNGEEFAKNLTSIFTDKAEPQLAHVANDGETYGHHHHYTDMALAYCLHFIESNNLAKTTIYGEYLEKFPPAYEVEINDNTSWSCSHGVERWRSNCGCIYGKFPPGKQQFRAPLREAMDWLRDKLNGIYEARMSQYVADIWELRNKYIAVINDRSAENVEKFISDSTNKVLHFEDKVIFLKLLEMERNLMLMFTSCGWFFDDISGTEAAQIMLYASRAIQLVKEIEKKDFEPEYESILEKATSNVKGFTNGKDVYEKLVKTSSIDLNRVAVHFAISSIFNEYPNDESHIYCYSAKMESYERYEAGIQALIVGRANISSEIVLEEYTVDFAVLYHGDPHLIAAAKGQMPDDEFASMKENTKNAFIKGDAIEVVRLMDVTFGKNSYSLWHLFKDEQRRILYELLKTTWLEIEASFRHIYEHNYVTMQAMRGMNIPLPRALAMTAEFILNEDLCKVIQDENANLNRLQVLANEADWLSLQLDNATLQYETSKKVESLMMKLKDSPQDTELLKTIEATVRILLSIVTEFDSQAAQNLFFDINKGTYPQMKRNAKAGDKNAQEWLVHFKNLAHYLDVTVQ